MIWLHQNLCYGLSYFQVKDSLEDGIKEAMDNYLEKESTRNAIDGIQSKVRGLEVCQPNIISICSV